MGPTGPTGPAFQGINGFAYNLTASSYIPVPGLGTAIDLPNTALMPATITVNVAKTTFTVTQAGLYRLSYSLNLTQAVIVSTGLTINGTDYLPSNIYTGVSGRQNYSSECLAQLNAGDNVQLRVFGSSSITITLVGGTGVGASLMMEQLAP